ncbi:MAG: hypothetical protein JJV93_02565 [Alphaproteobacteria bacterium]|nr:hypothetical protein [Alphaproteobacteria bacterium]MBL0718113.1 hypothetical protein [Alphaproteobacteria bacterium]
MNRILFMACISISLVGCIKYNQPMNSIDNGTNRIDSLTAPILESSQSNNAVNFNQLTDKDIQDIGVKWESNKTITRSINYKGVVVRIDKLRGDTDIQSMRLRAIYNDKPKFVSQDAISLLNDIAEHEMTQMCGPNASDVILLENKISADVSRPTPFYKYKVLASGTTVREYKFRCLYNR